MKQYILLGLELSKANLEFSKQEASLSLNIYFKKHSFKAHDSLLLIKIFLPKSAKNSETRKTIHTWLSRLAFTHSAFEILVFEKNSALFNKKIQSDFGTHLFWKKNSCFRLTTKTFAKNKTTNQNQLCNTPYVAKAICSANKLGKVDLKNPDLDIALINGKAFFGLGIKIWQNTDSFESRKAHLLKAPHPTGMNPRLARAMINLAEAKKELLDPFCGAGGLLIEGSLLGLRCIGTDINPNMVERAKINTAEFQNTNILLKDALNWNKKIECVVTDVPYGKSSTLTQDLKKLISLFLNKYLKLTNTLVLCYPNHLNLNQIIKKAGWTKNFEAEIYIHSSLTRKIILLKK